MRVAVRALSELGADVVLAPERWVARADAGEGVPLGELVVERRERAGAVDRCVVLDTTHAKDGLLDIASALRAASSAKSVKKRAHVGDLVVSRLRPYLRQIAFVHPRALEVAARPLALSSEFYVLAPLHEGDDLAFLLPFLLGDPVQAVLAAAQEGGHHPRVPRASLLALRVPEALIAERHRIAIEVRAALARLYGALEGYHALLRDPEVR
ncbi:MAG TPA: hypothetical protein VM580_19110 [Labilithrix sp.]|nr:hypothetical protein [Labilithrix sp.]